MEEEKRNFIDFILEAQTDAQLAKEFLEYQTPEELRRFFVKKGFESITDKDCKKLIQAKEYMAPTIDLVRAY